VGARRRTYTRTLRKTYCDKGHDRRGNVTSFGHCRTCDIERKRRARLARGIVPKSEWTHCARGHPFSGWNLIVRRMPDGRTKRGCRTCYNVRCREHMRRRRARLRGEPPPPLGEELLRRIDEVLDARQRCPWTSV
jgi:hypothetical protein